MGYKAQTERRTLDEYDNGSGSTKFFLGSSRWHIDVGDWSYRSFACGWGGNDYGIGGDAQDVTLSGIPVCKRCIQVVKR